MDKEEEVGGCLELIYTGSVLAVILVPVGLLLLLTEAVAGVAVLLFGLVLAAPFLFLWALESWQRGAPDRKYRRRCAREEAARRAAENARARAEWEATEQARIQEEARLQKLANDATAARQHFESYYRKHESLLAAALPPELLHAELQVAFPPGITPEAAWIAARDLIAKVQPLVAEQTEKLRQEQDRQQAHGARIQELVRQKQAIQERIDRLSRSEMDPEVNEAEIELGRRRIRELEEQIDVLKNATD